MVLLHDFVTTTGTGQIRALVREGEGVAILRASGEVIAELSMAYGPETIRDYATKRRDTIGSIAMLDGPYVRSYDGPVAARRA